MTALKTNALVPSERLKVCDHPSGFAYSGSVPCTGPRVCHLCGTNEVDARRQHDLKELSSLKTRISLSATMMVECPSCYGEGGDEGPITCTGRCDWCGGCRDQGSVCDTCEGDGEVEDDLDADHMLIRLRLMKRYLLLRHAMAAEDQDDRIGTWVEIGEWGIKLAHTLGEFIDTCEVGDLPSDW